MTELAYDTWYLAAEAKTRFDSRLTIEKMRRGSYHIREAIDENGVYYIVEWRPHYMREGAA